MDFAPYYFSLYYFRCKSQFHHNFPGDGRFDSIGLLSNDFEMAARTTASSLSLAKAKKHSKVQKYIGPYIISTPALP